ncbi:MAG TPA: DUF2905 domain-containing protein [Syntrophomonadaceae bacterium]|nr:DUF2905 domain-containing protein [Syntrophomonadaceae bacterium]
MNNMQGLARLLITTGAIVLGAGLILLAISKWGGGWRLPGDIYVKRENYSFYFPVVSCIIISLILTVIFNFINRR